ncbi:ATP synthase subunit I [Pleionea mediterranea]|uniref:ATP synthase protein I n=1 Tax=Pleionea mediterranea TaxID=523701 RepID=A0A316FEL1_9GAMM|nr:ATP synthase subunit I [Pleionea mediterranea]PWK46783.1 ATP synthase protein I [Pleionea mediterranea]
MSHSLSKYGRAAAFKVIAVQSAVVIISAAIALFWGFKASLSILLGGAVSVLPSLAFAYFAFRHSGARSSQQVVKGFLLGEAIKFFLTIVLFILVFKFASVMIGAVFIGFGVALVSYWLVPFVLDRQPVNKKV